MSGFVRGELNHDNVEYERRGIERKKGYADASYFKEMLGDERLARKRHEKRMGRGPVQRQGKPFSRLSAAEQRRRAEEAAAKKKAEMEAYTLKEREKAAKKKAKAPSRQSSSEGGLEVSEVKINGKDYLYDSENDDYYDYKTHDKIPNPRKKKKTKPKAAAKPKAQGPAPNKTPVAQKAVSVVGKGKREAKIPIRKVAPARYKDTALNRRLGRVGKIHGTADITKENYTPRPRKK